MQGFHVATFNLENLNRPGVFYVERDDPPFDSASFETKCNWIGSILDEGKVDLAGLQEVFSFEAVEAAVRKSKHMTSAGTPTVLAPGTENRANEVQRPNGRIEANGPFVGLATTLPVLAHESIAVFPPNVVLRIPFGVHGTPTDIVTLPINRYWKREQKQRLWDVLMYNVHDIQEAQSYRNVSYTHIFNGRYELLDHILVSQEFVRQFPERIAEVRNTRIFNDHIFDERLVVAGLQPAAPRTAPLRSDHGIPVTEISMRAAADPPQP
jgi:hypothetical protein